MRPLWYEFPEDAASWTVEGQHLVGDALLVAPVLTKVANFSLQHFVVLLNDAYLGCNFRHRALPWGAAALVRPLDT